MLLKAPAKINLTLRVLSKRADGYHEISSEMRAIRLCDEVEVFNGEPRDILFGKENLAYKAAELFLSSLRASAPPSLREAAESRRSNPHITINLKKNIPIAAGLGGGSADAAAVLLALAKQLRPELTLAEVAQLGAGLGADIPFCVYSCAAANPVLGYEGASYALCDGIGEIITPIANPEHAWVILVKPEIEISTAHIYELFDRTVARHAAQSVVPNSTLSHDPSTYDKTSPSSSVGTLQSSTSDNDLEASCIATTPVVGEILEKLRSICDVISAEDSYECGAENDAESGADKGAAGIKIQVSGSGPTVFVYIPIGLDGEGDPGSASRIYESVKETFPGMYTCLTETV